MLKYNIKAVTLDFSKNNKENHKLYQLWEPIFWANKKPEVLTSVT
jgi:hypothetical protein